MTYRVITETEAERDWHEAVIWYDKHEPGVGGRVNEALRAVLRTLASQPERFPRASRLAHKAKVPAPWPYSIYFTINREFSEVKVLAIWHGARNPAVLRRRLK